MKVTNKFPLDTYRFSLSSVMFDGEEYKFLCFPIQHDFDNEPFIMVNGKPIRQGDYVVKCCDTYVAVPMQTFDAKFVVLEYPNEKDLPF